jgi:uncharacterized protein (TIGR02646 family)
MHHLDRTHIPSPTCLNNYQYGRNNWGDLTSDDRNEIRTALEELQGRRCAYCECDLDKNGQHIEHFQQRGRYPQGAFEWGNLFWSCGHDDSCGIHKDRCGMYNHNDLIKPDLEDPECFFLFVADGSIALRADLNPAQRRRAEETLRVFNLNAQWGRLRRMRESAASGYLKVLDEIAELRAILSTEEIEAYIAQEFSYTQDLPFCTAIKHVLTPQGVRQ